MLKVFLRSSTLGQDELLARAQGVVDPADAEVTHAGLGFIEVLPPGITKATGLAVALERYGVGLGDVLVFGDMPNDLPMFARSPRGRPRGRRRQRAPGRAGGGRRASPAATTPTASPATWRRLLAAMSDWQPRLIATDMDGTLLRCGRHASATRPSPSSSAGGPTASRSCWPPAGRRAGCGASATCCGHGTAVCCNGAVLLDLESLRGARRGRAAARAPAESITAELRAAAARTPGSPSSTALEFRHEPIYQPRWDVDAPGVAEATLDEMVAAPAAKLLARHEELARTSSSRSSSDVVGDRADGHPLVAATRSPRSPPPG